MGKVKHKRRRQKGFDPTGLLTVDSSTTDTVSAGGGDADSSPQSGTVAKLVEKLHSISCEERECACCTIANLVSSHSNILQFLRANIVKVMAPLLLDVSPAVRQAALGAFRNMSVDGGPEICDTIVTQDVMTPLVTLLKQYAESSQNCATEPGCLTTEEAEVLLQAVHVLWNLCESSQVAVDIFNREKLVCILWPWLQMDRFGLAFSTIVAQCVYTVTEDNKDVVQQMAVHEALHFLAELLTRQPATGQEMLMQSLAAGIAYNLSGECEAPVLTVCGLVPVLANILQQDTDSLLHQVAELMSAISGRSADTASCEDSRPDVNEVKIHCKELDEKVDRVSAMVSSQQLAVEVITNICCPSDDDDSWEDCVSSDGSTDDLNADVAMDTEAPDSSICLTSELHTVIISNNIFTKVTARSRLIESSLQQRLEAHEKGRTLLTSMTRVQTHCLVCLSNMVSILDMAAVGDIDTLHDMWLSFSQLTASEAVLQNPELLEAATSALRATSEKLAVLNSPKLTGVTESDLQFLYTLGQECSQDAVRANAIRIVSIIGQVLAKQTTPHPLLKNVGLFLYNVVCGDQRLWVVAEALDAIFDVFAEDHTDPVLRELDLVAKLQAVTAVLKTKMKQQRRELGEHLVIVSTARTNLMRFINYKSTSCNGNT
ncbi:HEAT repeat-containing protein 3 [Lamellibrachia satsuma]|nr:HEAT repeat-containing protein 3 [Lamellibrachia satsuma]